jgi:glutaredoxin
MHAQVLVISVDSVPCLTAWADSLGGIAYPLLSDFFPHGEVAQCYSILRTEGFSERAIVVIARQRIIRYVDVHDIDNQPDNDELFRALAGLEPKVAALPEAGQSQSQPMRPAGVILHCTPWCPACRKARAYLQERGIEYVDIDVSRDRAAAQRVREWTNGYETTPTFDIQGAIVVDFDRAKLDEALGLA